MNTSEQIFIVDVNVIIHLEKANLLDILIQDKNIRIVDLVLYEEYEYKENLVSNSVRKIKQVGLTDKQMYEAIRLNELNPRNSIFDYYSMIVCRDNNYVLLTGDWKLKKFIKDGIEVHGAIWYVQRLREQNIIDDIRLKEIYTSWIEDPTVYIDKKILNKLLEELE